LVFGEKFPDLDCGLRKALVLQIQARLLDIMSDEIAWEVYADSKVLLKAVHECQCAPVGDIIGILTPPVTTAKKETKGRQPVRNGGVYKGLG
jgi:histone acetyltransferase HTATIP